MRIIPRHPPPLHTGEIYKIVDDAVDKRLRGKLCVLVRVNPSKFGLVTILASGKVTTIFSIELEEVA